MSLYFLFFGEMAPRRSTHAELLEILGVLRNIIETQTERNDMMSDELRAVHETTTNTVAQPAVSTEVLKEVATVVSADRIATPNSTVRPRNVSNLNRLHPSTFSGVEGPLQAE